MLPNLQLIKKDEFLRAYSHLLRPLLQTKPCSIILDNLELLDRAQHEVLLRSASTIKAGLKDKPNVNRELLNKAFQETLTPLQRFLETKGVCFEIDPVLPKVWHEMGNVKLNNVTTKRT